MTHELPSGLDRIIANLYPDTGAHGKDHALQTTRLVLEISDEPEYRELLTDRERFIVSIAALAHDAGYQRQEYWSGTQWEHPYRSTEIMFKQLDQIPDISEVERAWIALLVLNHDNTNYRFPAYPLFERTRMGFTEPVGVPPGPPPGILFEAYGVGDWLDKIPPDQFFATLQILQEADSQLGDAKRTIEFSKSRHIPIIVSDGGIPGIGMPMWQYSGLANVLLAAQRTLLDAYTKSGQETAWQVFTQTRSFIRQTLEEKGRDNVGELLRREDVEQFIWNSLPGDRALPHTHISQAFPLEGVPYILSKEYKAVASRLVNVADINGSSHTGDNLKQLADLRGKLLKNYALDILTGVDGALRVFDGSSTQFTREYTLIPPLVIDKLQISQFERPPFNVVSGSEWVTLARELNIPQMRILIVYPENIP